MSTFTQGVPVPLTRGRERWNLADTLAVLAILTGAAAIVAVSTQAYLRGDDWLLLTLVSRPEFGLTDLFVPYGSHLMPLGLAFFWAARAIGGPTPWWPLVCVGLTLTTIGLTFTWLSIRMLVGPRVKAVVPFLVAAWAPAVMTAVVWPAPSVYMSALFAATAIALWGYLRYQISGRGGPFIVVGAVVVGLLASQLSLLIPLLLFTVQAAWWETAGPLASIGSAWRRARGLWMSLISIGFVYLVLYLALAVENQTLPADRAATDSIVESLLITAFQALPAMTLLGPWSWNAAAAPVGVYTLPVTLLLVMAAGALVLVGRRARWRVWWPVTVVFAVMILSLSAARVATYGPGIVRNPYYAIGIVSLLAATLAVAYLPSALPIDRPGRAEPPAGACLTAAAILLASMSISHVNYAKSVPSSPSRQYLENAQASLAAPTLNTSSPRRAFDVFVYEDPWDTSAHTFDFVGIDGNWITSTDAPSILDTDGNRVPATVDGEPFLLSGSCVPVDGKLTLRQPEPREPNWPMYALSYSAELAGSATVEVAADTIRLPMIAGEHTVYFAADGRPDVLVLRANDVCVSAVEVGPAVPAG